jgi:putative transposase
MKVIKNPQNLKQNLISHEDLRAMLANELRQSALNLVNDLFKAEITELCGELFQRKNTDLFHRAGTNPGSILLKGQRVKVTKPRVKHNQREVDLNSYNALQSYDLLQDRVMGHMLHGVSTRDYNKLIEDVSGGVGLSKSSVSRVFKSGSIKSLEELNSRDLSKFNFLAVMIDGIEFGGKMLIVALGITESMKKLILGLCLGDSENSEVCKDLLNSIIERGFDQNKKYLFVLDGAKALRTAVVKFFGADTSIQRCVRHKERNIVSYLPKQYHMELRRRWKLIHGMVQFDAAKRELEKLKYWLKNINLESHASLEEAVDETLTVIKLQVSAKLRSTLLSTNPIESIFSQVRGKTHRIKRWKKNGDQVTRWAASTLLEIESKNIRYSYSKSDIEIIKNNLNKKNNLNENNIAA